MIAKRKKTFTITVNPIISLPIHKGNTKLQDIEIKYFTDSVYHSLTYSVPFTLQSVDPTSQTQQPQSFLQLNMNFDFLLNETKVHKKIFDNIGVINIKHGQKLIRYGILVTEQKGQIFVSLIE